MSRNTRTAVPIIATVACFLFVAGTANADTAHCKCKVATDHGGSVDHLDDYIYDFGVVATYDALFPQNKAHQDMCMTACSQAAHTWLSDKNKVCDGFTASAADIVREVVHRRPDARIHLSPQASAMSFPLISDACFRAEFGFAPHYDLAALVADMLR